MLGIAYLALVNGLTSITKDMDCADAQDWNASYLDCFPVEIETPSPTGQPTPDPTAFPTNGPYEPTPYDKGRRRAPTVPGVPCGYDGFCGEDHDCVNFRPLVFGAMNLKLGIEPAIIPERYSCQAADYEFCQCWPKEDSCAVGGDSCRQSCCPAECIDILVESFSCNWEEAEFDYDFAAACNNCQPCVEKTLMSQASGAWYDYSRIGTTYVGHACLDQVLLWREKIARELVFGVGQECVDCDEREKGHEEQAVKLLNEASLMNECMCECLPQSGWTFECSERCPPRLNGQTCKPYFCYDPNQEPRGYDCTLEFGYGKEKALGMWYRGKNMYITGRPKGTSETCACNCDPFVGKWRCEGLDSGSACSNLHGVGCPAALEKSDEGVEMELD